MADDPLAMADRLAAVGQYEQAVKMLENELARTPEAPAILMALGRVLIVKAAPMRDIAELTRASRTLSAALALNADPAARRWLQYADVRRGDPAAIEAAAAAAHGAVSCSGPEAHVPNWPSSSTRATGAFVVVDTAQVPVRADTQLPASALDRGELIEVTSAVGDLAEFRDARRTDPVVRHGWIGMCSALGPGVLSGPFGCECRRGTLDLWRDADGVWSGPDGRERVLPSLAQARRVGAELTGNLKDNKSGIAWIRNCEVSWTESQHVLKRVPFAALRPAPTDADASALIAELDENYAPNFVAAMMDGRWCAGMPVAMWSGPLAIDLDRPERVEIRGDRISEHYVSDKKHVRIEVENGLVQSIVSFDVSLPVPSVPTEVPEEPAPTAPSAGSVPVVAATPPVLAAPAPPKATSEPTAPEPCDANSGEWEIDATVDRAITSAAIGSQVHLTLRVEPDCRFELARTGLTAGTTVTFTTAQTQKGSGRLPPASQPTSTLTLTLTSAQGRATPWTLSFSFAGDIVSGTWLVGPEGTPEQSGTVHGQRVLPKGFEDVTE